MNNTNNNIVNCPWGNFEVLLDSQECKVKRITVFPNKRLSYQFHDFREENWTIIKGKALVILEGEALSFTKGDHVYIPLKAKHRIANVGESNLVFIEVQTGSYFGEDDIVRLEDDFNRAKAD